MFARQPTFYVDEWHYATARPIADLPDRVLGSRVALHHVARSLPLRTGDGRPLVFDFVERRR